MYCEMASTDIVNLFTGYIRFYLQKKAATFFAKRNTYFERNILVADIEDIAELEGTYEITVTIDRKEKSIAALEQFLENDALSEVVSRLKTEEKKILFYRFFEEKTDAEIAKILGVSRQRISKKRTSILQKLKDYSLI